MGFEKGHKLARGGSKPGHKSGNPSKLLKDMRWVYEHPEGEEGTPIQKKLRQVLNDNPKDFFDRLQRAEAAHRGGAGKSNTAVHGVHDEQSEVCESKPALPDENEARVLGLIDDLLKGLGVKDAV